MDLDLRNRVVLVVGGTGVIGSAVAEQLRGGGALVVTSARGSGADLKMDASLSHSIEAGIASVIERYGRLDALIVTAAPSARTIDATLNSDPAQVTDAFNAALIIAAKNLADELAGTGVTVNTVSPGVVTAEPLAEVKLGRAGESSPRQVADLVTFLSSPRSALSGESIAVGHRVRGAVSL